MSAAPARLKAGTSRVATPQRTAASAGASPALAALLAVSGASALVFQVLWVKQLTLVVGVEVHAIAAGVAAFFAGLALGNFLLGRIADRSPHPLLSYGALEAGIAIVAVAATWALAHCAEPFARIESSDGLIAWVLPAMLVAAPASLMGGTLPFVLRAAAPSQDRIGRTSGILYSANTGGAIAGALLAPFALIPTWGVMGSAIAAGCLNVAAALGAALLARSRPSLPLPVAKSETLPAALTPDARAAITLYAISGGIALGYEVAWSQVIVPFTTTRAFSFAVVLATYLAGLVIGSVLQARVADRVAQPWRIFALLIAAAGAVCIVEIAVLGPWLVVLQTAAETFAGIFTSNATVGMSARFLAAASAIVLVPTILLGAAFPFVVRIAADSRFPASHVGLIVALNTAGGIAGTLVAGFLLIPELGLVRTIAILALGSIAVAAIASRRGRDAGEPLLPRGIVVLGTIVIVAAIATPKDHLASMLPAAKNGSITFYEEGRGATVAVVEQPAGSHRFQRLYIQGVSNSGDAMPSLRYMRLQSILPLAIHNGEPRSALVIGLGTGITAGALLAEPRLDKRVVAELLPAVARAAPLFKGNYGAPSDPRIQLRLRDGRRELMSSQDRYDLITLEPPPPSAAGIANLYSTDFYLLARARLNRNGLVAQWLPLPTQNDEDTRSLVRSFLDAFPEASLWTTEFHEMLLVGSAEPVALDAPRIVTRASEPSVANALREVGIASPAALLATWVTDRVGLERYAGDAQPVTDDRPRIEYASWVRPREIVRTLPELLALQTTPPLKDAPHGLAGQVRDERDTLHAFYDATLAAYRGDREAWASTMNRVMRTDGSNPYYQWFGGDAR